MSARARSAMGLWDAQCVDRKALINNGSDLINDCCTTSSLDQLNARFALRCADLP